MIKILIVLFIICVIMLLVINNRNTSYINNEYSNTELKKPQSEQDKKHKMLNFVEKSIHIINEIKYLY